MASKRQRVNAGGLQVDEGLYNFINDEAIPGTGVRKADFWKGFGKIVDDLSPENHALLENRDDLQTRIDQWYLDNPGKYSDMQAYKAFLKKIGYLVPEGKAFSVTTSKVDDELTTIAGPQLVVPVMNARYALNAANARWGSLYDALYGTDAIAETGGAEKGKAYNPVRGKKVVAWGRKFLDQAAPLKMPNIPRLSRYRVKGGKLVVELAKGCNYRPCRSQTTCRLYR